MKHTLIRVRAGDGSWNQLCDVWRSECEEFGEDFDQYANASMPVLRDLAAEENANAGVFALQSEDGDYHAMCQANSTYLPGYDGKVLRVRHLLMSPYYDFGDFTIEEYSMILGRMFARTVLLSVKDLPSRHIKFHLRSPADRQFFATIGNGLGQTDLFSDVAMKGSWLYLTKANMP